MSKTDRDLLRRGEQLLSEWQIAADAPVAVLRDAAGRDAAADLVIAARLGARAEPDSIVVLQQLEAHTHDKLVRKEVRRSLYRLEQRGLAVPHAPSPAPPVVAAPALEGYLSAVDGNGDQLVWLLKPRSGGVLHVFAVLNHPEGLREVNLTETTRKAVRAVRQELIDKHDIRMVEADWRYCDALVDHAFHQAVERGQSGGDYPGIRSQLTREPVHSLPPLICTRLDPTVIRNEPTLLAESHQLLAEKELRSWVFERETLQPYLGEILQIRESPLVLTPVQQQERFLAEVERAVAELFGGARQASWVRRLEEMAYFFHASGRSEAAKRAFAAALALAASPRGGQGIPFCEQLTRSSLGLYLEIEAERAQEQASTSLVVTPQQAVREAQQRR